MDGVGEFFLCTKPYAPTSHTMLVMWRELHEFMLLLPSRRETPALVARRLRPRELAGAPTLRWPWLITLAGIRPETLVSG
jgi:hypothetical protein